MRIFKVKMRPKEDANFIIQVLDHEDDGDAMVKADRRYVDAIIHGEIEIDYDILEVEDASNG